MVATGGGAFAMLPRTDDSGIIYRTLGKTGIKLPVVSMGVMRADNPNLVKAAYENGMTHFDTANGYQGGRNETMLGEIFREWECRHSRWNGDPP